jgi:hypothetical protein
MTAGLCVHISSGAVPYVMKKEKKSMLVAIHQSLLITYKMEHFTL